MESTMRMFLACTGTLLGLCCVVAAQPDTNLSSSALVTNLVEIIPYLERFARHLDIIDVPEPLTTNHVAKFDPYRGHGRGVGILLDNDCAFGFDVKHHLIDTFRDRKHTLADLSRDQMRALRNSPSITKEQALIIARTYLARLGYSETNSPVLPPRTTQAQWQLMGEKKSDPLPFFTVEWPWKYAPDREYFVVEVDGIRLRLNNFHTMQGSPAEESLKSSAVTK